MRRVVDESRKSDLAVLAYARELGLTPAARMAIKANAANAALDLVASMGAEEVPGEPAIQEKPEGSTKER